MEYVVKSSFWVFLKRYKEGDIISEAKFLSLGWKKRRKCSPINRRGRSRHYSSLFNDSDIGHTPNIGSNDDNYSYQNPTHHFDGYGGGSGGGGGASGSWEGNHGHNSHHDSSYSDHSSSYDSGSSDSGSSDSGGCDGGGGDGGGGGD